MREYKLYEIDYEVGDIVSTRNSEDHQPYKVLAITPRIVDDSEECGRLHKLAYNLKDGDSINPTVTIQPFVIGGEREGDRVIEGDGWDVEHFEKMDLDDLQRWITYKEEDIAEDVAILKRLEKVEELIVESLLNK